MTKLNKKYVIGTHVMFFEIEMYKDFIDGLLNLIETVENKDNITIDLCFNMSEQIEKIDKKQIDDGQLLGAFYSGAKKLEGHGIKNLKTRVVGKDEFYFHADYRRDLNYNYCKKVDYVMWGETDSFFPKEAFQALESLSQYTDEQNIHRYIVCFGDRKMWDDSWNPTVHKDYEHLDYIDDENHHLHKTQAKSVLSIDEMNEINSKVDNFDFGCINYPKIDGSCLVISSDLIKFGVNVPPCLIYNDDEGLSIMAQKLCGNNFKQFICKNLLKVHARRHPQKRLYVLEEDNPHSFEDRKNNMFNKFKEFSQLNIRSLIAEENKFYEYDDFKNMEKK